LAVGVEIGVCRLKPTRVDRVETLDELWYTVTSQHRLCAAIRRKRSLAL
jgi:hypothetical protein